MNNLKSKIAQMERDLFPKRSGENQHKPKRAAFRKRAGKSDINALICLLERKLKTAEEPNPWKNDEVWNQVGWNWYLTQGKVAEKLGLDVLINVLLSSSIFDIVEEDDGFDIVLLGATNEESIRFDKKYSGPISEILQGITGDKSTISFYLEPSDEDPDSH